MLWTNVIGGVSEVTVGSYPDGESSCTPKANITAGDFMFYQLSVRCLGLYPRICACKDGAWHCFHTCRLACDDFTTPQLNPSRLRAYLQPFAYCV